MENDYSTPQKEVEYIDTCMQEMLAKHGHRTMLFNFIHDETIRLLIEKGYEVEEKKLDDKKEIAVTNPGKQPFK